MKLDINEFIYTLPQERIAQYPLAQRDQAKLLLYDKGAIQHKKFYEIAELLPTHASVFFNETKVIPARLHFQKETGAVIEIFLLNPISPSALLIEAMQAYHTCIWKCTIGNLKRGLQAFLFQKMQMVLTLEASLNERDDGVVKFSWNSSHSFAEVLAIIGETPLPPYLKRKAEHDDKERYQTVYSNYEGAVAAPTAGLHFTTGVFESLKKKNIETNFLTLHVSAGTFQPIKVKNVFDHTMHEEQIVVSRKNIETLLKSTTVIAVGTTSLRTLESLYWYGVRVLKDPEAALHITQQDPYTNQHLPSRSESLHAIIHHMDQHKKNTITGGTSIFIVPGYTFRICHGTHHKFSPARLYVNVARCSIHWEGLEKSIPRSTC